MPATDQLRTVARLALHAIPEEVITRAEREAERRRLAGGEIEQFLPYTMVDEQSLRELRVQVQDLARSGIKGAVVECGSWRGGAGFVMASALAELGDMRRVWLFDSFEGLPAPAPIDGPAANQWAANVNGPTYYDNCRASLEEVRTTIADFGMSGRVTPVKGWFEDTLPANRGDVGPIAILRIDGDWYASVKTSLEALFDQVVPGGLVIFDDYDLWDGCTLAVHEFLADRKLPLGIRRDQGRPYLRVRSQAATA